MARCCRSQRSPSPRSGDADLLGLCQSWGEENDRFRSRCCTARRHQRRSARPCRVGEHISASGQPRALGRRRDLEQRILGEEGGRAALDVSQAARRAKTGRAGASRAVFRARLVGDLTGVRSAGPWAGRVVRDGCIRRRWLRLLDHGPRELWKSPAALRAIPISPAGWRI
jgi:hypothetical protein